MDHALEEVAGGDGELGRDAVGGTRLLVLFDVGPASVRAVVVHRPPSRRGLIAYGWRRGELVLGGAPVLGLVAAIVVVSHWTLLGIVGGRGLVA
ncbi:hypothetical protein CALCODRAFT_55712 [Calocera cornea HHB12733]|uniref:Uncharacterized protein n=1 Tax=Calocera cornea HHB12733 TaxID=1353952 RepID=A0A165DPA2_9BASI|nr:hypothetical protein CALCODRAFT_55712 [Calocera cornea HHB12733]